MLRWREKSPGLKILWFLVTSVVGTRLRDMEKLLREEEEKSLRSQQDGVAAAATAHSSE
ncbi:unnamed protein product [Spirodela intermedia]|uniref:Uncharacterized protein n=1 Tax=Spirodela intermedia TaxID=51605 RepID=A0A7I8JEY0_SPIIN|nr:unnamed protein product [Spirodela intermedia]CAA6667962.1 unnamed protein product [Spirodela intermedia]